MTDLTRLSPPERFNSLIEGLFSDVVTKLTHNCAEWPLNKPLITLIWRRLHRMSRRFAAILARLHAGALPEATTPPAPASAPDDPAADPAADPVSPPRPAAAPRPPGPSQRLGWVIHAVSYFVLMRHYELQELLEDPETEALVARAPELGRILRPLCRMLNVKPLPWLALPRRPRPRRVVTHPPAPEWLKHEPGAICKPDGTIWMRQGASTKWRETDLPRWTLEEAQKFDRPVRIWPHWEWK